MKSLINSLNNMRWNKMFTIALSIGILLFAQACEGGGGDAGGGGTQGGSQKSKVLYIKAFASFKRVA